MTPATVNPFTEACSCGKGRVPVSALTAVGPGVKAWCCLVCDTRPDGEPVVWQERMKA